MLITPLASADKIRVAVASNFASAARTLSERFESLNTHTVLLVTASTGKHYAQIRNGAPYHVYLAADSTHPERLEREKLALPGTRFTYAVGVLALWSPDANLVDKEGGVLASNRFRYLAIANPKLAPYGKAAEQVLRRRGLWKTLQARMVRGENIDQAFQYVHSGNADLGFIALPQYVSLPPGHKGSIWIVPQSLYGR